MDEKERFINTIKKSLSGLLPLHMAEGIAERVAEALMHENPELLQKQRNNQPPKGRD